MASSDTNTNPSSPVIVTVPAATAPVERIQNSGHTEGTHRSTEKSWQQKMGQNAQEKQDKPQRVRTKRPKNNKHVTQNGEALAAASDRAQIDEGAPPTHDSGRADDGARRGSVRGGQVRGRGRGQTRGGGGSGSGGIGQRQPAPLTEGGEGVGGNSWRENRPMRGEVQLPHAPQAERGPRVEQVPRGLRMQQEQRSNRQQREPPRARAFEIALQAANRRQEAGKGQAQPSTSTNGASVDKAVGSTSTTATTATTTAPLSDNSAPPPDAMQPTTSTTTSQPVNSKPAGKKKAKPTRAAKLAKQAAHYALVLDAARAVVSILHSRKIRCAVFGSLACRLYGDHEEAGKGKGRCPKDVDLLITQEGPAESHLSAADLKTLILSSNPRHFYLKLPRDPEATYRILYYRSEYLGPESKVDILTPGTMLLPPVMEKDVCWLGPVEPELNDLHGTGIEGFGLNGLRTAALRAEIPLVPFPVLLLHKLQGWDDHRLAKEKHKRDKMAQDTKDIVRLLAMKTQVEGMRSGWDRRVNEGAPSLVQDRQQEDASTKEQDSPDEWSNPLLFPAPDGPEFMRLSRHRVRIFCTRFPDKSKLWKEFGFAVQPLTEEELKDEKSREEEAVKEGEKEEKERREREDEGGRGGEDSEDEDEEDEEVAEVVKEEKEHERREEAQA
ncbi:hypothetical protein BDQ12DRAFT_82280 [Crucibulum laeve]|uniref:Uncharacterized protein n=1 Tax=Crucibulum laeve TaxID=68775 RepID=A0A5C3LFY1_9AGAR|nr:hypothetical protein BDQ12DRAFT_82280 [Crucibulum laeve]